MSTPVPGPVPVTPASGTGPDPAFVKRYETSAIRERARQLGGAVMRAVREAKRAEAEARNAVTRHENTRAHRENRCACQVTQLRMCPWPDKDQFPSRLAAAYTYARLARHRKRQGLKPYRCPAGGHYHLGRSIKRSVLTWRRAA